MDQLNDLVKKAKKGDGEAFVKAVKQYEDVLYGVAKRLLNCDEDIADAMQEAIMKAFERINTLQNEKYFRTWICKILINTCLEILRKNKRIVCVEEILPHKYCGNEFLKIELNEAINSLGYDYKLAVILYYLVGLSTKEIGDYLKEPEGTIKSRLSRARTTLRKKYYGEEGFFSYGK